MNDADELLAVAEAAAQDAAALLLDRFGGPASGVEAKSSPTDLVSEADVAAEKAIRAILERERGDDAIVGEEGGGADVLGPSGVRWVVDPLDGTTNYLYGLPAWAVTLAAQDADGTIAGVVLDPNRDELFTATRDGPPLLDGEEITTAPTVEDLGLALLGTGFGYDAAMRAEQGQVIARVLPRVRDIRRGGSAAIDLAWTACGRYDCYFERGLNAWDAAAGALVCERAGLDVRMLAATDLLPGGYLAAPAAIAGDLHLLVS